mgnify:CR=1 FL=1
MSPSQAAATTTRSSQTLKALQTQAFYFAHFVKHNEILNVLQRNWQADLVEVIKDTNLVGRISSCPIGIILQLYVHP